MPPDKTRFRNFPKDPFFKYTNQPIIQYEKPIKGGIVEVIERFEIKETWDNPSEFPILVAREPWNADVNLLYDNRATVSGWNSISQTSSLGDPRFGVGLKNSAHLGKVFKRITVKLRRIGFPNGSVIMRIEQKDSAGLGGRTIYSTTVISAGSVSDDPNGQIFLIDLAGIGFAPYVWNITNPLCITFDNTPQSMPSGHRIEIAMGDNMPGDVTVGSSLLSEGSGADIWGKIN